MRVIGWVLAILGAAVALYGLNYEFFAVGRQGVEALSDPAMPLDRVLFTVFGGFAFVGGVVLIAAGRERPRS